MSPWPLPALTTEDLAAQLTWRVVGPHPQRRHRIHALLQWAGVSGPAPYVQAVAALAGVSEPAFRKWLAPVFAAGATVPLTSEQRQQLNRPSFPGDDHRARSRRATLFGLDRPPQLHQLATRRWPHWTRLAELILAAAGPLTLLQLHAGISNAKRTQEKVSIDELGVAILAAGTIRFTGQRYTLTAAIAPRRRHAQLVAHVREHGITAMSYTEATHLLMSAGWTEKAARATGIYYNPLLTRHERGRWILIDQIRPPAP